MDEDDDSAALHHQMQLEQQQMEEEALAKSRALLNQLREGNRKFEADMTELNERIRTNWREFHGDHG